MKVSVPRERGHLRPGNTRLILSFAGTMCPEIWFPAILHDNPARIPGTIQYPRMCISRAESSTPALLSGRFGAAYQIIGLATPLNKDG